MGFIAGFLGFFVPGLGQLVNKEWVKGIIVLFFWLGAVGWAYFSLTEYPLYLVMIGSVYLFFSVYSAIDGFMHSGREKERKERQFQEFKDFYESEKETVKRGMKRDVMDKYLTESFKILEMEPFHGHWKAKVEIKGKEYSFELSGEGKILD